ncbi:MULTISPECIES: hypothetical protein [Neorhizobium]|jgi:predicted nucleic acid-binding protein|uniref:hypothetical protein n=1 Tax=Neorhizobium TaxID=1525371 RepID=UPI000CF8A324|nr:MULTISPECIES: hypothetical protein [Neorhizobium]
MAMGTGISILGIFQGRPMACAQSKRINDAYIAATAFTCRMTLVTRNIKDFEGMGVHEHFGRTFSW